MFNRRNFLKTSSLLSLAPTVPLFLQRAAGFAEPDVDKPILVVIELNGGNDGLNTIVPYLDDEYHRSRDRLRLQFDQLHRIADGVGLHPAMKPMADLFSQQELSIVQGVGYPNSSRSHDASMTAWHIGGLSNAESRSFGWIGRAMDELSSTPDLAPKGMLIGNEQVPAALRSRNSVATSMESLDDWIIGKPGWDGKAADRSAGSSNLASFIQQTEASAATTAVLLGDIAKRNDSTARQYPATRLSNRLQLISKLIQADLGTRFYYTIQSGYDTHQNQLQTHSELLSELSSALTTFLKDLKSHRLDDRVLVLCFSEFGRQVKENGSAGTDHGTSGPVFLAGSKIAGGLLGSQPDLTNLADNAPTEYSIDFRRIYSTILNQWLGLKIKNSFEDSFAALSLFR